MPESSPFSGSASAPFQHQPTRHTLALVYTLACIHPDTWDLAHSETLLSTHGTHNSSFFYQGPRTAVRIIVQISTFEPGTIGRGTPQQILSGRHSRNFLSDIPGPALSKSLKHCIIGIQDAFCSIVWVSSDAVTKLNGIKPSAMGPFGILGKVKVSGVVLRTGSGWCWQLSFTASTQQHILASF